MFSIRHLLEKLGMEVGASGQKLQKEPFKQLLRLLLAGFMSSSAPTVRDSSVEEQRWLTEWNSSPWLAFISSCPENRP